MPDKDNCSRNQLFHLEFSRSESVILTDESIILVNRHGIKINKSICFGEKQSFKHESCVSAFKQLSTF